MQVGSAKQIADGKGVHREVESERSPRQTSGLTNRNRMRRVWLDEAASQAEVLILPGSQGVDAADVWRERLCPYPGRSHGRMGNSHPMRLKQDLP